ncbi:hypothetical protein [Desulfogranum japonicum]|uniref:hypothetical protein n=1 Tax=Desulfogranum japonicum TaxID=231447 RepID=UPI0003FE61F1|nr:hypothetical protein [Desulfogranum japonicum]
MLKFLPGIFLLQIITVAFVEIFPVDFAHLEGITSIEWLRLAIPLLVVGLLTAFWLGSTAAHMRKDEILRLRENHAKEREGIITNAERAKAKIVKQAHQETLQEVRRTSTEAKIKVGATFIGAAGVGALLLLTQFMTLGLLLLTAAGGALGGYTLRIRQEKGKTLLPWKQENTSSSALEMKKKD